MNPSTPVRRAAEEIVLFIQELDKHSLGDFWLPTNAFVILSTMALLLRCAVEEGALGAQLPEAMSFKLAQDLRKALQSYKQDAAWDLGDICISQFSDVLDKFAAYNTERFDDVANLEHFLFSDAGSGAGLFWDLSGNYSDS
ncbi:MAG: hypothetical protein Q9165_003992 [Trypethelium subeluteriae]